MFPEKATLEWKVRKRIVLQKLDRENRTLEQPLSSDEASGIRNEFTFWTKFQFQFGAKSRCRQTAGKIYQQKLNIHGKKWDISSQLTSCAPTLAVTSLAPYDVFPNDVQKVF